MNLIEQVESFFGGGALTPALLIAGLVTLYLGLKTIKLTIKFVLIGVAGLLFLGTAPLGSGSAIENDHTPCVVDSVTTALGGWQEFVTKHLTVESITADARCASDGLGLAVGSATVKLRTVFDIPVQTWEVDPSGTRAVSAVG